MGGHVLNSGTAYRNARLGVWPLCRDELRAIEDGNLATLTAWERARCNPREIRPGAWTQPADFFKIRSASLSFPLPEQWLPAAVSRARLSLQGRNLLTLTDFDGLDPESSEGGSESILYRQEYYNLPPLRTLLVGVRVEF